MADSQDLFITTFYLFIVLIVIIVCEHQEMICVKPDESLSVASEMVFSEEDKALI